MEQQKIIVTKEISDFVDQNEEALENIENLYRIYISELMDLLLTRFAQEKIDAKTANKFLLIWSVKTKSKDLEYLEKTLKYIQKEMEPPSPIV